MNWNVLNKHERAFECLLDSDKWIVYANPTPTIQMERQPTHFHFQFYKKRLYNIINEIKKSTQKIPKIKRRGDQ